MEDITSLLANIQSQKSGTNIMITCKCSSSDFYFPLSIFIQIHFSILVSAKREKVH